MKFTTVFFLSGLAAGVLAAPFPSTGNLDATDLPVHGQPSVHGAFDPLPDSDASAPVLHVPVSPDHGAGPAQHNNMVSPRQNLQDVYNIASGGNVITPCVKNIETCVKEATELLG
ncbi:hypothetical protein BP00DRAFT_413121 [Aspergillus indologenus CBS 114.80]|uniref:Uncharacterized protein n=1 Tax=Aspergillus indologenus CBS 114.80 TaxID=1450541 RepID=A0A2V5JEA8_9EURO|nr:hypothetical protein BP00DRAFT_413121 [Aspergillus indologenus CBS 114.80]